MSASDNRISSFGPLVFDIFDFRGKRVIFTKKKLDEKKVDHPELGRKDFIEAVRGAIREPEEVWEDYSNRSKQCYYGKYEDSIYAKVVIYMSYNKTMPSRVVSAYAIDKIKERKYKGIKRIV